MKTTSKTIIVAVVEILYLSLLALLVPGILALDTLILDQNIDDSAFCDSY